MKPGAFGRGPGKWRLDESAQRFAADLKAGKRPRIEVVLEEAEPTIRPELLKQLVVAEASHRREQGEDVRSDEYAKRFPELPTDEVEQLVASSELPANRSETLMPAADTPSSEVQSAPPASSRDTAEPPPYIEPPQPSPVETIGRYRLGRVLGSGTFGEVLEAIDPELDRKVALKLPRKERKLAADAVERFRAEGRVLARLRHPGLVAVYDAGVTPDGRPFVVSELIEGEDLAARIAKHGKLGLSEATRIVAEAAEALAAAHAAGVVHRDVKPANILLDRDDNVRVADFGIALPEDQQESARGEVLGSPAYMAPEQFTGEAHLLDGRADIWALGVVLYELLTGRRPFPAQTFEGLKEEVLRRDPRPVRQLNPKLPPWIESVVAKCLAKRAADRYATAADLALDLRRGEEAFDARRGRRRGFVAVAASMLTVGLLGGLLAFVAMQQRWPFGDGEAREEPPFRQATIVPTPAVEETETSPMVESVPESNPTPPAPPVEVWLPPGTEPASDERIRLSYMGNVEGWTRIVKRVPAADGGTIDVPFVLVPQRRAKDPPAFYMMETKVWNDLFRAFATANPMAVENSQWTIGASAGDASLGVEGDAAMLPVFRVRLREAIDFATWLGGRLPLVEQWDKAAGFDDPDVKQAGPFVARRDAQPIVAVGRREEGPLPVGSAEDDVSPHGLRDMAGNGWEFTRTTWYGSELRASDLQDQTLQVKHRGRSYAESKPLTYEMMLEPQQSFPGAHHWISFRVVLEQE